MEVGQKVKVLKVRDQFLKGVQSKVGAIGTIKGFKMTDASSVGMIVEFEDQTSHWFFEDELETQE